MIRSKLRRACCRCPGTGHRRACPCCPEDQQPRELTEIERQLITDINTHNSAIKTMVGRFLQIDTEGNRIEGTFYARAAGQGAVPL